MSERHGNAVVKYFKNRDSIDSEVKRALDSLYNAIRFLSKAYLDSHLDKGKQKALKHTINAFDCLVESI